MAKLKQINEDSFKKNVLKSELPYLFSLNCEIFFE